MKHKFSKSRKYSKFIDHLNHSFTNLADLWNRIGFNSIVKAKRLDSVFKKLIVCFKSLILNIVYQ